VDAKLGTHQRRRFSWPIQIRMKSAFLLLCLILSPSSNERSILFSHAFLHSIVIHNSQSYTRKNIRYQRSIHLYEAKEVLAREGDWAAYLDMENTGLIYYFNTATGESVWDAPTSTFPKISMSKRKKEKMMNKRREYFEGQQQQQQQQQEGGTLANMNQSTEKKFFGGLLSNMAVKENIFRKESKPSVDMDVSKNTDIISEGSSSKDESSGGSKNIQNTLINRFFSQTVGKAISETDSIEPATVKSLSVETSKQTSSATSGSSNSLNLSDYKESTSESTSDSELVDKKKSFVVDVAKFFQKSPYSLGSKTAKDVSKAESAPLKTELQVEMISRVLPHPEKVSWGGEDATFCSGRCFGVFDGVSGANKEVGKPLYSLTLANVLKESLGSRGGLSISQLKSELMDASLFADTCATGATTALIASIGADGFLRAINLGDSVLMVIRDEKLLVKTNEKIHYFDCPVSILLYRT